MGCDPRGGVHTDRKPKPVSESTLPEWTAEWDSGGESGEISGCVSWCRALCGDDNSVAGVIGVL